MDRDNISWKGKKTASAERKRKKEEATNPSYWMKQFEMVVISAQTLEFRFRCIAYHNTMHLQISVLISQTVTSTQTESSNNPGKHAICTVHTGTALKNQPVQTMFCHQVNSKKYQLLFNITHWFSHQLQNCHFSRDALNRLTAAVHAHLFQGQTSKIPLYASSQLWYLIKHVCEPGWF